MVGAHERAAEALEVAGRKLRHGELSRRDFMKLSSMFGLAVTVPGLAACGSESTGGGTGAGTGTLKFLVGESFWANWHPYNHTAQIGFKIQRNIFDRLVEVQPDLELTPGLAESWEQVDDRTWDFRLREGVTFHGGQAFTAEDVKASIELASGSDPKGKKLAMAATWGVPHSAEVVDDLTVRLRGDAPFGPLMNTLAITDICSAADIAKGAKHLEREPNGTGAFKLVDDRPNRKTLARFDDHYRGPAKLEQMVWEFIQDSQTRLNALLAGQAHVIDRVEPDQLPLLEKGDGVEVISITAPEVQAMWFRQDKDPFGSNVALRRAFAWSLDRQAMNDLIGGNAKVPDSHLAEGLDFRAPQSPEYQFDPERAKAELDRAGGPVSFELGASTGFYPKSREVCELAKQNLEEVGFTVKLTLLELAAWIDMLFGEDKPGEVFHGGWGNLTKDPDFAVATLLRSPGAWTGAHDKTTDKLIDDAKQATDPGERERIYGQLQEHLWQQLPSVPVTYSDLSNGVRDNVSGYEVFPTFVQDFWPVEIALVAAAPAQLPLAARGRAARRGSGAARFLARRTAQALLVIFGVACVTFLVLRLVPGDPARLMVPPGSGEDVVQSIRERLGTDQPLLEQFWLFITGLVQGDLGESFRHERPVLDLVVEAFPATLALAATTLVFAVAVAVPLGIAAAARPGGLLDRATLVIAMVGQSLPNFWIGVMLVLLFAVERNWFPAIGNAGPSAYVLPTLTLSAVLVAALLRTVRQSMLEALHEDYIRTARAKGVPQRRILLVHALKNAAIPLVTVLGLQVGFVLGGAFVVELIFNWPGVGLLALQAIETRDFPVVQGVVIFVATAFVLVNLLVDVAYAFLNPRVRFGAET